MIDVWKLLADGFVALSTYKLFEITTVAIFSGQVYGPGAFVAGAAFVGTVLFTDYYARETIDGYASL